MLGEERQVVVNHEISKLLDVDFIQEIVYTTWLW